MIRRLGPADWLAFRDIRLEMLREVPEAYASSYADWDRKPEAMIRDWLANIETFAACTGARITSCAALSRARQPGTEHRAEVIAVYTRPAKREEGLMRAVLERMAQEALKAGILQLELQVNAANAPAIAAYEKIGFARHGVLPRALRGPDGFVDDILMIRALDAAS